MLRRKLLIRVGLLVACFVTGAAVAIMLLQNAIAEIDRLNKDAVQLIDGVMTASDCLAELETARSRPDPVAPDQLHDIESRMMLAFATVGGHAAVQKAGAARDAYGQMQTLIPEIFGAGPVTPDRAREHNASMRELAREMRAFVAREQLSFGRSFRTLVLGLTLAALVMVNVAVIVLLRTAQVVLKPVNELVMGSRELAAERFDHRVAVQQEDEFGELARSYNSLAQQLAANEERKAEALRQLAVTLNHDLNNAMATIEMQLCLLDRQSGGDSKFAKHFRDIQSTLARMSRTVASLKNIRRVVLTDYVDGQKMVDIEQSVIPLPVPRKGEVA
ncbi:MAG: HAMP domain-containing protein [Phycisphaerales bacterium]